MGDSAGFLFVHTPDRLYSYHNRQRTSRGYASHHLPPEATRTLGRGLEQLFEQMLAAEGRYFFDDPDSLF